MFAKGTTFLVCSTFAMVANAFHVPKNTVQDAHEQAAKMIRCWEPVNMENPVEYFLSEPVYELCSYMPHPKDYTKFFVNGVSEDSDDYTNILQLYNNQNPAHAMLTVCLQEAFQFHRSPSPSQVSLRCLCKRDGCNMPKDFTTFLDLNKLALPAIH